MDVLLLPFLEILYTAAHLYFYIVFLAVIFDWLVRFQLLNTRHAVVHVIADVAFRLTEPPLRTIRRFVPFVGGLDLSPLILIFALSFFQGVLQRLIYHLN